ncbi:MAG TPA: thiamine-monophosphate kinase [Planctomycetes bacterium]|nr:thiamine-monophosphate kinase [Planctomycetota bacterium]
MSFNEDQLHRLFTERFQPRADLLGPGNDCAILVNPPQPFCISCDQLIAGVHFDDSASNRQIAEKLIGRSLSDLAAAGASPYSCTITCAFPNEFSNEQSFDLCESIIAAAEQYDLPIIGGDCSSANQLVLSCTVMGRANGDVPQRNSAQAGGLIFVSRQLGGAVLSGRHLSPKPELALGKLLVEQCRPQAMIDLSDGFDNDLRRVLHSSNVGAIVDVDSIPLNDGCDWQQAVCEGEDYGLLVILAPTIAANLKTLIPSHVGQLYRVGEITRDLEFVYQRNSLPLTLDKKPFRYS